MRAGNNLVLIVDDNFQNRELLVEMLSQNGYATIEAISGEAALNLVRNNTPDVILMDVRMPEMDGFETCIRLQKAGFDEIPVVFMTAVSDNASIQRAFEIGAADYIAQPVRQAELLARLEMQFQKKLLLETLWKQNENLEANIESIRQQAAKDAERLNMALQVTGLGIWEWDIVNDHIYWSPEVIKLFGREGQEFDGLYSSYIELIHADDRSGVMEAIASALENPSQAFEIEHRLWHSKELIWLKGEGRVVCDDSGKPVRILGTVYDNTKHKLEDMVVLESQSILQAQTETLMAINQIANTLYQSLSINELAKKAIEACCIYLGADSGAFYVLEGELLRRVSTNVVGNLQALGETLSLDASFTGAMVRGGKMLISENIADDNRYVSSIQHNLVELGIKRLISIPLSHNETILGALNIGFKHLSSLEGDTRATLETIGKTIGLALSNARTLEQMRKEVEERQKAERIQKILFEISRTTSRSQSLAELLAEVRLQLGQLVECENFYVALYDEERDVYSFPYWKDDYSTEAETWVTRPLKNSRPDYVRQRGEGCILNEEAYKRLMAEGVLVTAPKPSVIWMGVPLKTAQKVIGVMAVQSYTDPQAYSESDLEVMNYIAENIVWVIENKRIEDALRASEELFSKAFYASPDSVTIAEASTGKIMQVNQGFERVFGYRADEAIGRKVLDLNIYIQPSDRERMLAILARDGRVRDFEIAAKHQSGRLLSCSMSVEPIEVYGIPCVVSIARDITERKEAQAALERSEANARDFQEKLRELLEISMELSRQNSLVEIYQKAIVFGRERLGYDRLGLFLIDMEKDLVYGTFGTDEKGLLRDEREHIRPLSQDKTMTRVLQAGRKSAIWDNIELNDTWKSVGRGWNGMAVLWDGDKGIGALATDNLLTQQPIRPYEQELLGLYGAVLGFVISGKRVEAARQHVLERLQFLNNIEEAILAAESPRAIARVVIERLESFLKCDYASVFSIDDESKMMHMLAWTLDKADGLSQFSMQDATLLNMAALEQGKVLSFADLSNHPNLSAVENLLVDWGIHSFAIIPLLVDGVLVGTMNLGKKGKGSISDEQLAIAQEIATQLSVAIRQARLLEQVQAYASDLETLVRVRTEQLEAKASELEAFTYSVSHDLRSPLRAMSGFAEVLMDDFASELSTEAQHYLERIRLNAQRMGTLIDDLLALSRVGRRELSRKDIQPKAIIEEIISELEADEQIGKAVIEVGELADCQADPVLLKQLWSNLISNAIKYSKKREKPQIRISSQLEKAEVIYCIQDNGVGFDMQYAEKLFGVFQRLHSDKDYEGTGIGLATVYRIIERHNGRIWAEAEVDKGARFYFVLGAVITA